MPSANSAGNVVSQAVGAAHDGSYEAAITPDAVDHTSILKGLKKTVLIGSTVDPTNGDTGPRSIHIVGSSKGLLKQGQLLVCNFADKTGAAGKGTTIEMLDAAPKSKPTTFVSDSRIEGCDGDAISAADNVYASGLTSGVAVKYDANGKYQHTYKAPIQEPLGDTDAYCSLSYIPENIYLGDGKTGSIVKWSINGYGNPKELQAVTGFGVNGGTGWDALGPSGIVYNGKRIGNYKCTDIVYVADGVDNTLVAIHYAGNLLVKDEIVVLPGGKTFKCKHKKVTCASLVYSGSPLDAPVALTLLPNGNLIAANSKGNKLVEIAADGTLLATKSIDKSSIPHIFGLAAEGKNDKDTVLFLTYTKNNSVYELKP
ncbi:MAG: hypothetical protein JO030_01155 [Candidatus Eremiobacteraeota bacterium]|nr:hypothetical protein [Candidatus Eremiobacteraeota bacterium]